MVVKRWGGVGVLSLCVAWHLFEFLISTKEGGTKALLSAFPGVRQKSKEDRSGRSGRSGHGRA